MRAFHRGAVRHAGDRAARRAVRVLLPQQRLHPRVHLPRWPPAQVRPPPAPSSAARTLFPFVPCRPCACPVTCARATPPAADVHRAALRALACAHVRTPGHVGCEPPPTDVSPPLAATNPLLRRSMGAMVEAARGTGLSVRRVRDIGPDYAITLRAWRAAWEREHEASGRAGAPRARLHRPWRPRRAAAALAGGGAPRGAATTIICHASPLAHAAPSLATPPPRRSCPWATPSASGSSTSSTLPTARRPSTPSGRL